MVFLHEYAARRIDRFFAAVPVHGFHPGLTAASLGGFVSIVALHAVLYPGAPDATWIPALAIYIGSASALRWFAARHYPHDVFGWCNTVTLFRWALACVLITPLVASPSDGWTVVAIATVALSLDGLDGWLARRNGLVSRFGARFDMEVDAALALVLTLHALADGLAGPIVLILGLSRYVFVAAIWVAPWLRRPLPERYSRKAVCVLQILTLIILQVPFLTAGTAFSLALAASLALLASFARDVVWLHRHRR